jgi:hypothetical protein
MLKNNQQNTTVESEKKSSGQKPNENGYVRIDAYIRITDPKTQQVLVEVRE